MLRLRYSSALLTSALLAVSIPANAAPPSGAHPRLFMTPANIEGFKKNASTKGTAAATLLKQCNDTITDAAGYNSRGGNDGNNWPGGAIACAFAYRATQDAKYLTPAIKFWRASLEDDQTLGDKLGCVAGVDTNWQSATGKAPPVILTVTHDSGYPMRWYGPDVALTYDWLFDAPGVDDALRVQTRTCLGAWVDWYSKKGYHFEDPGTNYNAGFVIGKALTAIAFGNDGGNDGHIWNEAGALFNDLLVGKGLLNASAPVGTAFGRMVGGDWAEGWQYGPLSILEYAVATRAMEENGVPLPAMDAWVNTLIVRLQHATTPAFKGSWVGGDFDDDRNLYTPPNTNNYDAVLAGPSNDTAAAWAADMKKKQTNGGGGGYFYNALAELRPVTPQDYRTQTPAPALWYLAQGTRAMYVRTGWDDKAFWGVFSAAPMLADHQHHAAGNLVLSRGVDNLIVDTSVYGEGATNETNAFSLDSTLTPPDYTGTQTPFSRAELLWARGTTDAVHAARADLTKAMSFLLQGQVKTDITYAHREWVMLPEGEVVTIDRGHMVSAAQKMHVGFHTNTGGGKLTLDGSTATGTVGGSQVTIHAVHLSGGAPQLTKPDPTGCHINCNSPCGQCDAARLPVDKYRVDVPGPWAVAVHVIDALGAGEAAATTGSIDDDNYDPAPKQNAGVVGAAVFRGNKQTFVIASSAIDGAAGPTMTYGVPAKGPSRHIVFDAPEDAAGKSNVAAAAQGDRCVITITAGTGFAGRPLLFSLTSAADGCKLTEATDVAPGAAPPGGGVPPDPNSIGDGGVNGAAPGADAAEADDGCSCRTTNASAGSAALFTMTGLALFAMRRRRRSTR